MATSDINATKKRSFSNADAGTTSGTAGTTANTGTTGTTTTPSLMDKFATSVGAGVGSSTTGSFTRGLLVGAALAVGFFFLNKQYKWFAF